MSLRTYTLCAVVLLTAQVFAQSKPKPGGPICKTTPAHVTVTQPTEKQVSYPSCPDSKRLVFLSKRELMQLPEYRATRGEYGYHDSHKEMDIEFTHALCMDDSITEGIK